MNEKRKRKHLKILFDNCNYEFFKNIINESQEILDYDIKKYGHKSCSTCFFSFRLKFRDYNFYISPDYTEDYQSIKSSDAIFEIGTRLPMQQSTRVILKIEFENFKKIININYKL